VPFNDKLAAPAGLAGAAQVAVGIEAGVIEGSYVVDRHLRQCNERRPDWPRFAEERMIQEVERSANAREAELRGSAFPSWSLGARSRPLPDGRG